MRLSTRQTGIISYAGLDADALWEAAKRAFFLCEEGVPERFSSFIPLFPVELVITMSYVGEATARSGARGCVSPCGFSIDPVEYHQKLYEELPELYAGDNFRRNFDHEDRYHGRGVVTVDHAWAARFPQYQPFMGERLAIYPLGGGCQAAAVPESVYPRGGGVLRGVEREMRVTSRAQHYAAYVKKRLQAGERYDSVQFEDDYLRLHDLLPVCVRQAELGRVMQDLCIVKSLRGDPSGAGLFTENAKRAENVTQYAPYRYACDTFESAPVTRATARLAQLSYDGDFIGDLWLPYQDVSEYVDRQRMALDVRALCEGFQIAPAFDGETGGGRYPNRIRVVVVRDRELRPMVADTLNNPAYGSGMSPLGMLNRLVFLPDSAELLRERKLAQEDVSLTMENLAVSCEDYGRMQQNARVQELKGKLIDAMYRREAALSQMQPGTQAFERARQLLDEKVGALEALLQKRADGMQGQLSGYDADLGYLRRMRLNREGLPEDGEPTPVAFAEDSQRELSIESGYAMRGGMRRFALHELEMPEADETDESAEANTGRANADIG